MRRNKRHVLTAIALTLGIVTSQFGISSPAAQAASKTYFAQTVTEEAYQKAITKGFLGKAYGVGGGRYVSNTYVGAALAKVPSYNRQTTTIKNLKVKNRGKYVPTSYDWTRANVRYTYHDKQLHKTKTVSIKKKNKGTSLRSLEMGDVLTYGSGGGHVALYFGEFKNARAVINRLVSLGVYKSSQIHKSGHRYRDNHGRVILHDYHTGTHWRVHATNSGLLIDNAVVSRHSNGTSSFGRWSKTIPSGFTTDVVSTPDLPENPVADEPATQTPAPEGTQNPATVQEPAA